MYCVWCAGGGRGLDVRWGHPSENCDLHKNNIYAGNFLSKNFVRVYIFYSRPALGPHPGSYSLGVLETVPGDEGLGA